MTLTKTFKLDEIATIQMGYSSIELRKMKREEMQLVGNRDPLELIRYGLVPFINVRNVHEGRPIRTSELMLIKDQWLDGRTMRLNPDDIVFLTHGFRYFAAIIPNELPESVCSSYFYSIRIDAGNILPGYVCWYLNQLKTKNYLTKVSTGSQIRFIRRQDIKKIPISIPSIDVQSKVVAIEEIRTTENDIIDKLKLKKNILIDTVLKKLIDNPSKNYE